jgi:transcriptional repressor NrdR
MRYEKAPTTECPNCGDNFSAVSDSRPGHIFDKVTVRRRRVCSNCDSRFTTYEVTESQVLALKETIRKEMVKKIMKELL